MRNFRYELNLLKPSKELLVRRYLGCDLSQKVQKDKVIYFNFRIVRDPNSVKANMNIIDMHGEKLRYLTALKACKNIDL